MPPAISTAATEISLIPVRTEGKRSSTPAATATYGEVAKAVRGKMFDTKEPSAVGTAVGRMVKMAGVDTTMQNALRDGAEWAWIPSGDTCAFCLTLASRGWQKASKQAIRGGHAEHIHNNCDCTYAIRFDGVSDIEGYDPDKYLEMYENADDSSYAWGSANNQREGKNHWQNESTARINGMRRAEYAKNKDAINAQKREAYARRKEFEENWNAGKYFKRDNPGT